MYIVCTDQVSKQEDEAAALGAQLQAQNSELQAMKQDTALREEMTHLLQHANTDIVRPRQGENVCTWFVSLHTLSNKYICKCRAQGGGEGLYIQGGQLVFLGKKYCLPAIIEAECV